MVKHTKIFKGGSRIVVADMRSDPPGPTANVDNPPTVTAKLGMEMHRWLNENVPQGKDIEYRCTVILEADYEVEEDKPA